MPITIGYDFQNVCMLRENAGLVGTTPALPTSGGLYVIYNSHTSRGRYIGTASNIRARFDERFRVVRELGFHDNDLSDVEIFPITITLNGARVNPGDDGCVWIPGLRYQVDVEFLLIRIYINRNCDVRNITKVVPLINTHGTALNYQFIDSCDLGPEELAPPWNGGFPNGAAI